MRLALAAAAVLLMLLPLDAHADDCPLRSDCICTGARTAIDGVVTAVSTDQVTLSVEAVDGDASLASVGSAITVKGSGAITGERWTAFGRAYDATWYLRMKVGIDGRVSCWSQPGLVISSADARAMSVSPRCSAEFVERAQTQALSAPPCGGDDAVFGCSSAGVASALALLPLVLRRSKR